MTVRSIPDDRLNIFSFLLAAAVIFHLGKWNIWLHSPVSLALGVSAVFVLMKPSSTYGLYALLVLVLADAFEKMPWIPNHWLFATVVSLTILSSALILIMRDRRLSADRSCLFDTFAPALRLELVLLYFFAIFHKLNRDWLDPGVSCGTVLFSSSLHLPLFPGSHLLTEILPIYGTLILEASIPLFLLFRKTRIAGIILALVFHFLLGVFEYYNFSALTYALLYLFAPDNFTGQLREWWTVSAIREFYIRFRDTGLTGRLKAPVLITAGAACLALFIYANLSYPALEPHIELKDPAKIGKTRLYYVFLGLWWIYGLALISIFLLSLRKGRPAKYGKGRFFVPAYTILMLFPLLIVINGASPYLGLKTQTAWSMFSNLRTEGGYSNHLIVRHPYCLAGYQTDLVEIRRSSDPRLSVFQDSGYLIPYFELRRYLSLHRPSSPVAAGLVYIRNGTRITVSKPEDDPELFTPPNYILRKLLSFRPVPSARRGFCQH
jgi:vitamin K-dependent gamma-carboxylase-like protein